MKKIDSNSIDGYIESFPPDIQKKLHEMRAIVRKAAPEAEEAMKYGIPTLVFNGNLVHFGAFKSHIGFYPSPSGIMEFKKELSKYKGSKGAIQFPYDQPLPKTLISKIVKYRIQKNADAIKAKKK